MKINDAYDEQVFLAWIEQFLPGFITNIQRVDIPGSFEGAVSIKTLGESELGVRVFVIETDNDPSRRRIGLATDSFTVLKNSASPNAIIAYYSKNTSQWRLSLLTSSAVWGEDKVIIKLSNPKRQSYVLGPKAKVKTPHQFLIAKGNISSLEDLKSRFSLEVVNKEFYKEISKLFTQLVGGTIINGKTKTVVAPLLKLPFVQDQSQTALEFAVRLIGRVIFCWFLREKKSNSGSSLIPKELVSYDKVANTEDYYHKILEPIFFEVLNKPQKSRLSPFDDSLFSQVPYLNGGLFSPQDDDFYKRYKTDLQSQFHNTLKVPDEWIRSFFEVLETYNFTIDENTSFDEELSIDPEMLGRIFENLLAEINPETGESARKSTGSYYTPRVIVDYMVDESLYLYLKDKTLIEEKKLKSLISYDLEDDVPLDENDKEKIINSLGEIKILDPACGSGAFPIGSLQKIVFILQQADPDAKRMYELEIKQVPPELRRFIQKEYENGSFDYLRKLRVIRDCIYGVDIQPIATEISRLRCFLTLIVDQKIDDTQENRGVQPLPNLDFKFVTANSLISLPKVDKSQTSMFDDYEKIDQLKSIRDDYFSATGLEREQLKTEFVTQQKRLVDQLIKEHGFMGVAKAELTQKLTSWEPFTHKPTSWFDPEWMFGIKKGFDVVIANPPYINAIDMKKNFAPELRKTLKETYKSAKGAYDLYILFFERGFHLLNNGGHLSYITPNKYLSASYAVGFREFIVDNYQLKKIVDVSRIKVFSEVSTYPIISFFIKHKPDSYQVETIKLENQDLNDFFEKKFKVLINENKYLTLLPDYIWGFLLSEHFDLVKKIYDRSVNLTETAQITATSTAAEADIFSKYISEEKSENSRKLINTGTIDPYVALWGIKKLTNKGKSFFEPYLDLDGKEISENRKMLYAKPKIIVAKIGLRLEAVLDKSGDYASINTNCLFSPKNGATLKYIIGYLHSTIFHFIYDQFFGSLRMGGGYYQFQAPQLKSMPILTAEKGCVEDIDTAVDDSINNLANRDSLSSKDCSTQDKINKIFYKLFELTEDEIKIIEKTFNG